MANSFEPKGSTLPLVAKGRVQKNPESGYASRLPPPKPKRKQCSLYLDAEMMDRVKKIARQRGVTIGAVIEACVNLALDQIDE